jgi:DNA-binding NtrC family response regulator
MKWCRMKLKWEFAVQEKRLLLVENEAPLRRSLEKCLENGGYSFDGCSSLREALIHAQSRHYDVAVVEYHLSDGDGTELIKRLRSIHPNLLAIMISPYDFQTVAEQLSPLNVHSFLKKPFDPVDFEVSLRSACARC